MIDRGKKGLLALLAAGVLLLGGCAAAPESPPPSASTTPTPSQAVTPAATPTQTPTPTPTCGSLDGHGAAAEAIAQLPPAFDDPAMSDVAWHLDSADVDGYDPCATLSWIVFSIEGGTVSSPSQIALFHRGEYLGPATERAYGFWPDVVRIDDGEIEVTYTWPQPDESNAEASGRSVVRYAWQDGEVHRTGELPLS